MRSGWATLGAGLGLAVGVVAGSTLFADDATGKQHRTQLSAAATAAPGGPTTFDTKFVAIDPARAFDSRIPAYIASGAFTPNTSRIVAIRDGHNASGLVIAPDIVPVGATAISYNLTIAEATGPNFVAVTRGDATSFTTSAINFDGTSDVANAGIVSIGHNRTVRIWNGDQTGTTHVIIDITGYFVQPMYAEVYENGSVTAGSRVTSWKRIQQGVYDISFDRNVVGCAKTATIGDDDTEPGGLIDHQTMGNTVRVFTAEPDSGGAPTPGLSDRSFDLVVTC